MTLTVLHTNDIHGHLSPWQGWEGDLKGKTVGGLGRLAGAIAQARKEAGESVLVLDAGDLIGDNGLKNVANILKEVEGAEIEVVCHGGGIGLLVKDKSEHADEVARLIKEGVRFAACENTLRDKSIPKEDLLPGVATVPSGVVEVIRKQQEGYGCFKP
jgi:intracellular sulfur oxidation DsrE/DsrF family protein